jgi:hypothetical protein
MKKKGKRRKRLPLEPEALRRIGIQLSSARIAQQDTLEEIKKRAGGMKRLIVAIEKALEQAKAEETVITDYGLKFYPKLKWPKTVAHWRKDLCRTKF